MQKIDRRHRLSQFFKLLLGLIINTTAKANDTTDILQTFR